MITVPAWLFGAMVVLAVTVGVMSLLQSHVLRQLRAELTQGIDQPPTFEEVARLHAERPAGLVLANGWTVRGVTLSPFGDVYTVGLVHVMTGLVTSQRGRASDRLRVPFKIDTDRDKGSS